MNWWTIYRLFVPVIEAPLHPQSLVAQQRIVIALHARHHLAIKLLLPMLSRMQLFYLLPIFSVTTIYAAMLIKNLATRTLSLLVRLRSEERRVGKEGRSRWARYH